MNFSFVERPEDLCLSCGMCCDGTLYDFVKLEPGDDVQKLKELGLPVAVSRGKVPVARVSQPCAGLCANRTCGVYSVRPRQCAIFECGVLKDLKAGRVSFAAALRQVKTTRRLSDRVRRLLRELGDADERRALGERFHRTSERLEAGGIDDSAKAKFADLSLAVHRLKLQTLEKFYTQAPGDE
jgi:Fe-S-cluster containining protein